MGEIAVHEFITVDGVVENPGWTADYPFDPRMGEAIGRVVGASEGILLGRRTYDMFAPAWSARTADDDPGAPFFNESAKYVVSSTLEDPDWNNSHVLGPYDPAAIHGSVMTADQAPDSGADTLDTTSSTTAAPAFRSPLSDASTRRWDSTGPASALMSSGNTCGRPFSKARAWPQRAVEDPRPRGLRLCRARLCL